jgi:hypothetical protein
MQGNVKKFKSKAERELEERRREVHRCLLDTVRIARRDFNLTGFAFVAWDDMGNALPAYYVEEGINKLFVPETVARVLQQAFDE